MTAKLAKGQALCFIFSIAEENKAAVIRTLIRPSLHHLRQRDGMEAFQATLHLRKHRMPGHVFPIRLGRGKTVLPI